MKVEIDLNDILQDGEGYSQETLQESIRRQVITQMTETLKKGIQKQIDTEISQVITTEIKAVVQSKMPQIVDDLINIEYVKVDRYGSRSSESTTFRKELVAAITEDLVYKKTAYNQDKNALSKAIEDTVGQNLASFKAEFGKLVTTKFTAEAMKYAVSVLREKLGLKGVA